MQKNLHSNANDLTNHQHSTSLSSLVIHKTYKQNADNYEGPKGCRLEVGARRAPKLLVSEYFPRDHLQSISLCSVGILGDRFALALCAELLQGFSITHLKDNLLMELRLVFETSKKAASLLSPNL